MRKVKMGLTLLSIVIIVGPLAGLAYTYKNNWIGLVLPPQITTSVTSSNSTLSHAITNFKLPQSVGQPQYNPDTGAFSSSFNFTNPLSTQLSVQRLSAEVVDQNNVTLGNVSVQPVNIPSDASAIVTVTGTLSQSTINQLAAQYSTNSLSISLANVNINVGGVIVHIDQISNIGSIPTTG